MSVVAACVAARQWMFVPKHLGNPRRCQIQGANKWDKQITDPSLIQSYLQGWVTSFEPRWSLVNFRISRGLNKWNAQVSGWGGGGGGSPGVPPTWRQPAHYSLWHRGLLELGNFFLLQFVHIGRFGYQLQVNKVLRLYSLVFEHTRKGLCQWTRCTISHKRSIKPRGRVVKPLLLPAMRKVVKYFKTYIPESFFNIFELKRS